MSFIYITIKNHFHINGFALSLALKVRFFGTRKWPIGMPNNEGMRRQPPPGGWEGKNFVWSHLLWTPINWPRGGQKPRAAMHHSTSAQAQHDGIYRSYLFPASPISFPELRSFWSASEIEALGTRMSRSRANYVCSENSKCLFSVELSEIKNSQGKD